MHWGRKFFLPQFYGTVCVEITFYLCLFSFLSSRFRERIETCESDASFPLGIVTPHLLCFSPLSIQKSHCSLCWETLWPLSSRASPAHLSRSHPRPTYLFRLWEHLSTSWSHISTEDPLPLADPGACFHWSISLRSTEAPLDKDSTLHASHNIWH